MTRTYGWTYRRLMYESERVLRLPEEQQPHVRSAVQQVLECEPRYRRWEASHSRLMHEVAGERREARQALAMRRVALQLIHRRALIDHIRAGRFKGEDRHAIFRIFYGPKDPLDAILLEHRQYLLAASSGYCADVLIDHLHDQNGHALLVAYEQLYREYFAMYCRFRRAATPQYSSVLGTLALDLRHHTKVLRERLYTEQPQWHATVERRRKMPAQSAGMRFLTGPIPDLTRSRVLRTD